MAKRDAPTAKPKALDASHRVVILHGPEVYMRSYYTAQLRAALEAAHGSIDTFQCDGAAAQAADVLDECRSFGLMAAHKLVIVDDADQFVKESSRPALERYAAEPCGNATLLLRAEKWRAGKLDDIVPAHGGAVILCEPLDEPTLVKWCIQRGAKRHHAAVEPDAAELLVLRVGQNMARLDTELEKLAVAARAAAPSDAPPGTPPDPDAPPTVSAALVARFVGMSREEEVWDIKARLLTNSAEEILTNIRDLLEVSRHPPTLITYAMIDLARALHAAARATRAGANPYQLAGKLKLWGPSRDIILQAARHIRPEDAHALLTACLDADRRQKSGLGDGQRTVERLALKFAALAP